MSRLYPRRTARLADWHPSDDADSRYNPGPDRPYTFDRERLDADNASRYGTVRISGVPVDERDVPDRGDC